MRRWPQRLNIKLNVDFMLLFSQSALGAFRFVYLRFSSLPVEI